MKNIRKKLARATDLPESSFGGCPYITIESNSDVKIDGCLEILSYSENEVSVRLSGMEATVCGSLLTLRSYAIKTIRICGKIESISLSDRS